MRLMAAKLQLIARGLVAGTSATGGDGPEGPMMDQRVIKVESAVADIKASLRSIEDTLLEIKTELKLLPKAGEIGEIKGRLSLMPTTWQLVGLLLTTWAAGMCIAIALMRLGKT
jgi:hypothetical protein